MWLSLLTANWRIIAIVLAAAAVFYAIDDRAYHSGLDNATDTCVTKTVPAARLVEQEACLANMKRVEQSNENISRDRDAINTRYNAAVKRLSAAAGKYATGTSAPMDQSPAKGLPVPAEGGDTILALGRDAETRNSEFLRCREFVLEITAGNGDRTDLQ